MTGLYSKSDDEERKRHRLQIVRLQADIAYFEARLEMIGEPATLYQATQRLAFELLRRHLLEQVLAAGKKRMAPVTAAVKGETTPRA
ncbi:hypothetical protein [Thiocapsa imhoffii]|uniref:hypothetical protein n=1 Tax=Thiocapsa imhoffii TaxID=382777 RepID=UPI001904DB45|nr:hypothetical protein [Thiocapsa imhoffii]